jgi:hypothetical protein
MIRSLEGGQPSFAKRSAMARVRQSAKTAHVRGRLPLDYAKVSDGGGD